MSRTNSMFVYSPTEEGVGQELLMALTGFEISLNIVEGQPSLGYQPAGQVAHVKVYDPAEKRDVDNDFRAWRFSFLVTRVQVLSSTIYVMGYSTEPDSSWSLDAYECREDHLPWEHDGNCYDGNEFGYEGWLELRLYPTDSEDDVPTWEMHGPLERIGTSKVAEVVEEVREDIPFPERVDMGPVVERISDELRSQGL